MPDYNRRVKVSLTFLLIIAVVGTVIRAMPFWDIPFNYMHLVHAHSHVAFQGWVYTLMLLLLPKQFLSASQIHIGRYGLQFLITVPVILGIWVSFTLQGYALYSIIFSTLFQVLNYWFIFRFLKDSKKAVGDAEQNLSLQFVRIGLYLGLLSTLAPYLIGFLSAKGLSGSEIYNASIYFFLHFQYNGWFLFVAFGLLMKLMAAQKIRLEPEKLKYFLWLMGLAVVPAYALSLLGMSFRNIAILPAALAAILQLIGTVILLDILRKSDWRRFYSGNYLTRIFLTVVLIAFVAKVMLQFLSFFPFMELYAFGNRDLIIAYLHLSLIGVISFLMISILFHLQLIKAGLLSKTGSAFLLGGFFVTEGALLFRGMGWANTSLILLIFSLMMAVGVLGYLLQNSEGISR